MTQALFLDIEGVVVDDLENLNRLEGNIHKLNQLLAAGGITGVFVFSFGIFTRRDERIVQDLLDDVLGFTPTFVLSVDNICDGIAKSRGLAPKSVKHSELFDLFNKSTAFLAFMENISCNALLVDDTVGEETHIYGDTFLNTINIGAL